MKMSRSKAASSSKKPPSPKKSSPKRKRTKSESPILAAVHETASGLYRAGLIGKSTMKEFDAACLPKVKTYTPSQIQGIRTRCGASQPVFAAYLNVTVSSVQKWETGQKRPNAAALKLLNLVDTKGFEILK